MCDASREVWNSANELEKEYIKTKNSYESREAWLKRRAVEPQEKSSSMTEYEIPMKDGKVDYLRR